MHEMSIAQSIVDIVREEMARYDVKKLEAINLAVGKMSAVVPQHLSFCFSVLVDKTDLEGTRLNIREVPMTYRCHACGHGFEAEQVALACPACSEEAPRLEHGRELAVESIEVADLDAAPPPAQPTGDL